jgi:hypothetical protein
MLIILNNLRSQRANRQIAIKQSKAAAAVPKAKDMKTFIRFHQVVSNKHGLI